MIRFHQTFGAHAGRVLTFDQEVVRFGRMPDSDFVFDPNADLDASGRHAEVRRQAGRWVLVDVGSRNGTFIAGHRVSSHPLSNGEEIEFGPGGPRVRVEIPQGGGAAHPARPDAPTLAASDVDPALYTDPEADTMVAPAYSGGGTPSVQPPATKPPPPMVPPTEPAPPTFSHQPPTQAGGGGIKWVLGCGLLLFVVGVLSAVGYWAFTRVAQQGSGAPQLDAAQTAAVAQRLAAQHFASIHRLVERTPDGQERTLCTAFAVRPELLATAARCVVAVEERRTSGSTFVAIGGDGVRLDIAQMWRHPGFVAAGPSPDVGLLEVRGSPRTPLPLPEMTRLASLAVGEACFLFEHPEGAPAATVVTGSLTSLGNLGANGPGQQVVCSAPGAAGAPVLDADGNVVGIHVPTAPGPGTGPGHAVRADLILGLLAGMGR